MEGVQREAIVGSRTTLDVLNAQQALVASRIILVQNLSALVNASYAVAAALGRLTARDIELNVRLYDETAYHQGRTQRAGRARRLRDRPAPSVSAPHGEAQRRLFRRTWRRALKRAAQRSS